jgi:hypothetical protein
VEKYISFSQWASISKKVMLLIFEKNKEALKFSFWVNEVLDTPRNFVRRGELFVIQQLFNIQSY